MVNPYCIAESEFITQIWILPLVSTVVHKDPFFVSGSWKPRQFSAVFHVFESRADPDASYPVFCQSNLIWAAFIHFRYFRFHSHFRTLMSKCRMQRIQRGVNILDLVIKFLNLNSTGTGTLLSYARMTELQRKCKPEASLIQCSGSGWIRVFFR